MKPSFSVLGIRKLKRHKTQNSFEGDVASTKKKEIKIFEDKLEIVRVVQDPCSTPEYPLSLLI